MIETTVLNFLSGKLRVPVLAEVPEKPPGSFAVVEKTGVGACRLVRDYNFTDTANRRYRYQAVFKIVYY